MDDLFILAMRINPYPYITFHNILIVVLSVILSYKLLNRWAALALGYAVGMATSCFWLFLGVSGAATWRDILYEPVFEGKIFYDPGGRLIVYPLSLWVLPLLLAILVITSCHAIWPRNIGVRKDR